MVEDILRHLREIADEDREEKEETEYAESEFKEDRDYVNIWENRFNLFRKSEAAQFLSEKHKESFDQHDMHLQDLIYNIQRLAPYLRKFGPPFEKIPFKYRDPEGALGLMRLDFSLDRLTRIFYDRDKWYEPNYLTGAYRDTNAISDYLGLDIDSGVVKNRFLTTEQWRDIHHNMQQILKAKQIKSSEIIKQYESLIQTLPDAEAAVRAIATEVGVGLKWSEPQIISKPSPLN